MVVGLGIILNCDVYREGIHILTCVAVSYLLVSIVRDGCQIVIKVANPEQTAQTLY